MTRRRGFVALGAALLLAGGLLPFTGGADAAPVKGLLRALPLGCNKVVAVGQAHCYAQALGRSRPNASSGPTGLGPTQIQSAYKLAGLSAAGRTVAIVDAYDDKTAEADLATYRAAYGLPACTTASGCFKKVNQNGVQGSYPTNDVGWATEISLDLDAVSAACPSCHILLVEATSPTNANLYTAVDTAARTPGVVAISNSYGGAESSTETTDDSHFNHPGIAITVSSGDSGYGVEYPAASRYVTAVGGTTLTTASNARGWTETVWSGAGSGCSAYEPKPATQTDAGCAKRTVADVSAVADPNSGLGVYDSNCDSLNSLLGNCFKGWAAVGGTSLSSPLIASVYALAGGNYSSAYPYSQTASLFDVTSGSNGSCSGSYLCTGTAGYDGPTGLGTPNGTGAF
ncbi:MAG: serine protease [Frankiales bacterium]|nr:serine protease [Frankiales bacterium]